MATSICALLLFRLKTFRHLCCFGFGIAPATVPAYSNCLMGQQHRVTVKRRRRKAYDERRKAAAAASAPRRAAAKTRSKKTAEKTAQKAS
ncbi:MAG: hypothetical protein ABI233_09320 [Chthoniobacterales bacterium]